MSRRLKVCPYYARVEARKDPSREWREGSSFYCLPPPPPPSSLSCVSCTRVNRQPNLDVSSRPRLACWLFTGPRALPPFISHYEDPGSGLESCAWKAPDPLLPFAPLWPLHPRPARWYRSGVRSQGAGKVVSLFVSMDDETVRSNLTNLSERVRSSS